MNNSSIKFVTEEIDSGKRLDSVLSKKINQVTRSFLKKMIEQEQVKVNNIVETSPSKKIKVNQTIITNLVSFNNIEITPYNTELDVVFEDKDILIINKPAGMVVHPGAGNYDKTLVNALVYK